MDLASMISATCKIHFCCLCKALQLRNTLISALWKPEVCGRQCVAQRARTPSKGDNFVGSCLPAVDWKQSPIRSVYELQAASKCILDLFSVLSCGIAQLKLLWSKVHADYSISFRSLVDAGASKSKKFACSLDSGVRQRNGR